MSEIALEINGVSYTGFTSASASKSMEHISGEFSFEISILDNFQKNPIKVRDKCRVLVDKKPFITGYVKEVSIDYSSNEHKITINGRDKTCDIIDSTLGDITFTAGVSLEDIIKKVLKELGLQDDIEISSTVKMDVFDATEINNISSQIGETAFNFIEKYAKKRQVLVMSDGDGNIVLTRKPEDEDRINTALTTTIGYQPTILKASIKYDDNKRFYKYILRSQSNQTSTIVSDVEHQNNSQVVSMEAIAYDEEIRKSRIMNLLQHDDSYNSKQDLQDRANWEANYRKATGFTYRITVQGFSPINDNGIIWQPNLLVFVTDEYCDIPATLLLVRAVKFDYSIDGGSQTTLELIDKDGYSVEVLQDVKYKKKKKQGRTVGSNVVSDLSACEGK